jgi:hypothetical protein
LDLLARAERGDLRLYVPAFCLREAKRPLQRKFQPRAEADKVRKYVQWGLIGGHVTPNEDATVRRILDQMENAVRTDLARIDESIRNLAGSAGVEVVPYEDEMMRRAFDLGFSIPDVGPHDPAILATVLVRAERLLANGTRDLYFCELDGDLQHWDKNGHPRTRLTELYDAANVWVCNDYLLENPLAPEDWHDRQRE